MRGGSAYYSINVDGRTVRRRAGSTPKEAHKAKIAAQAARDRGERPWARAEHEKVVVYADRWLSSYRGRGKKRIAERSLNEYRRDLENHCLPWFGTTQMGGVT